MFFFFFFDCLTSCTAVCIDYWARPPCRTNSFSIFGMICLLRQTDTHAFIKTLSSVILPFHLIAHEHEQTFTHANNSLIGYFTWPLLCNVSPRTHLHAVAHPFPAESMLKALCRWDDRSTVAEVILQGCQTHYLTKTCLQHLWRSCR